MNVKEPVKLLVTLVVYFVPVFVCILLPTLTNCFFIRIIPRAVSEEW